jgi:hypothetical protein
LDDKKMHHEGTRNAKMREGKQLGQQAPRLPLQARDEIAAFLRFLRAFVNLGSGRWFKQSGGSW